MAEVEDSYVLETLPAVRAMKGLTREIDDTTRALQRSESAARNTETALTNVGRARVGGGRFGGGDGGGGGILESLGLGGPGRGGRLGGGRFVRGGGRGGLLRAGGAIAATFFLNREIAKKVAADRDPANIRDPIVRRAVQIQRERQRAEVPTFIRESAVGKALAPFGEAFLGTFGGPTPTPRQAFRMEEQEEVRLIEEASQASLATAAKRFSTTPEASFFGFDPASVAARNESIRGFFGGFTGTRSISATLGW